MQNFGIEFRSSRESGLSSHVAGTPAPEHQSSVLCEIYDRMSRTPHAVALTDGTLEWTYDDLRRRSDAVAKSLVSHGITHGSVVGMHLPRCADAIAAMLGIMISGCVYLPLDPSYPSARLQFMLDRAGAVAVISQDSNSELYGSQRIWLPPPSQLAAGSEELCGDLFIDSTERFSFTPEDCAYILFTSGSTGQPKGVMVSHRNITLMNAWSAKALGITALDATATSCSLSFDASFHETLLPLSVGGTVHVIPHALGLGQLTRPVSLVATTPTVANELLRAGRLPALRVLMLGGEALTPDLAARLLSSGRVGLLLNCYGPTECTVCVTVAEVTAPIPEVIPIGRQVPGTEVLILDEKGRELPDGEIGQICVFGVQVAQGYINDPAETSERFAVGLGATGGPRRYYRTGDLGYRTPAGVIYFLGRADRQVKINGIRIELGEVDAVLRSRPQVSDAITIARGDGRIVSYVVPARASVDVDLADLKAHLARSLPRYMIPAGIVVVVGIPQTVNGKVDTLALPPWSPNRTDTEVGTAGQLDESTDCVIQVISDVLGFDGNIRPSDDFLDDLGGTSLDIVRTLVELERRSGRRMRINDALADTSVAGLARLLRKESAPPLADFTFNANGDAQPVFFVHAYLGGMLSLRRVAELFPSNQPVYGLHAYCDAAQFDDDPSLTAVAQRTLARIRQIQPKGQVVLVGHSAGGLIVFEIARKALETEGEEPRVLLLDSPLPRSSLGYYWGESLLYSGDIIRHPARSLRGAIARISRVIRTRVSRLPLMSHADDFMALTERQLKSTDIAVRRYRARPYEGSVTVMRTRQGRAMALGRWDLGWSSVTRGMLEVVDIPGTHLTMLDAPQVHTVTEKLMSWLSGGTPLGHD